MGKCAQHLEVIFAQTEEEDSIFAAAEEREKKRFTSA
jgi:hypothetical protein